MELVVEMGGGHLEPLKCVSKNHVTHLSSNHLEENRINCILFRAQNDVRGWNFSKVKMFWDKQKEWKSKLIKSTSIECSVIWVGSFLGRKRKFLFFFLLPASSALNLREKKKKVLTHYFHSIAAFRHHSHHHLLCFFFKNRPSHPLIIIFVRIFTQSWPEFQAAIFLFGVNNAWPIREAIKPSRQG